MKLNNDIKYRANRYCDLSANEESSLRLIASLLLQVKQGLDEKEANNLGQFIDSYLNKKILIDHYFWERSLLSSTASEIDKKAELKMLKQMFIDN